MRRTIRAGALLIILAVGLTGCFGQQEYEQKRRAFVDAAVAELDPGSLGDIVCDVAGGKTGPGVGLSQQLMLRGPGAYEPLVEKLHDLDYSLVDNGDSASGSKPVGIMVIVRVVHPEDEQPGSAPGMYGQCKVPPQGGVSVSFEERDVGTSASAG